MQDNQAAAAQADKPRPDDVAARVNNRSRRPNSKAFREFIARDWAPRPDPDGVAAAVAPYAAARREAISKKFPGDRLVIPAGPLKVRSNDSDYRFRPHSAFAHLTGFGRDHEPDAVLVLEPTDDGHDAQLFFRPRAGRDTEEFYANARYGELWVGVRPSLEEVEAELDVEARHLDDCADAVTKDAGAIRVRLVTGADPTYDQMLAVARADLDADETAAADAELVETLSELRLIKDDYEIAQMREAIAITAGGFEQIARALPRAIRHDRGERVVEGAFESHAREDGNGVGYETIAASGPHACTLHWIRNDGTVDAGDVILVDAGAEADSLYTADVTRSLPTSGTYSDAQRRVYQAVVDAADAAFAVAAEHGEREVRFRDLHAAAMKVLAHRLEDWGLLPGTAEESLREDGQFHRRWMVHGTSHHLGLDVHDCAQARAEMYMDALLEPGMVFTIEPGLYFKEDDLAVPEGLRGIGVRLEDDVLVTADGVENLSAALPRTPGDVEAWMRSLQS
nr:aminopeptidase P family protein [Spelaeicoccus albus]